MSTTRISLKNCHFEFRSCNNGLPLLLDSKTPKRNLRKSLTLSSVIVFSFPQQLTGPTDHSYFDSYPPDEDSPPDELSGWDMDF